MYFEHYLAEKLGRTVEELRHTMEQGEFQRWAVWYRIQAQHAELERMKAESRR